MNSTICELKLKDHLTKEDLENYLQPISLTIKNLPSTTKISLLVDASTMNTYDVEARAYFVDWNTQYRAQIQAVAIVTPKLLWHMVVAAMAIASRQTMKAFSQLEEAHKWLKKS